MYNGSSGEGSSLRDTQYVHWDCKKGGAAGEQAAIRQRVAGVKSGVALVRCCCMWGIYTGMLPAEKRERWHEGLGGTNEQE